MATTELVKAGEIIRQEFDAKQVEHSAETQSSATAAREQAAVQARYLMALRNPRDTENFRVALLKECKRPGFAEMAEYCRPVGKKKDPASGEWIEQYAVGPSVHLIRTAISLYWNMMVDSATMYESQDTRIVHAYALDLQTNVSQARTIVVSKIIEKRGQRKGKDVVAPEGREVVGERVNTYGEKVFLVIATEDEVRIKESRLIAIAQRENGRAILPRDIIDEARMLARATVANQDAKDPDAALRKLVDSFAELNVKPADLAEYLGHQLDKIVPAEIKDLRGAFVGLRDGETTWSELMAAKNPTTGSAEAQTEARDNKIERLRKEEADRLKAREAEARQDNQQTTEKVGSQGGGSTSGPANSSGSTGPATAEPSAKPSDSTPPESTENIDPIKLQQLQALEAYERRMTELRKPALFRDIMMRHLETTDVTTGPWPEQKFMDASYEIEEALAGPPKPGADIQKPVFGRRPNK